MGAKENLNEAMFSMFGVGKAPAGEMPAEKKEVQKPAVQPAVKPVAQNVAAPAKKVTYLAPGCCMEGKLKCQGDVDIAGIFKGDIEADGKVTVCADITGNIKAQTLEITACHLVGDVEVSGIVVLDEKAVVEGKITAGELISAGRVKGDLNIKSNVALKAHTTVEGNIVTGTMSMESGAIINGSLLMKAAAAK